MSSNQYMSSKNRLFERLQEICEILDFDDTITCESLDIDDTINCESLYFPEATIDLIDSLKWEFQFLDFFLRLHCFTNEPNMVDLSQKVQTLFEDALVDFSDLYIAEYFDFYTSKVKNKVLLTKMEIRATYLFPKISLPISANKDDFAVPELVSEFVHSVAESLPELVKIDDPYSLLYFPETMENVKDLLKELEMLRNFSWFVSDRFIEPQISQHHVNFFTHVSAVAGHAAMLTWLYLPDLDPEEIGVLLSDFLRMRIKPIQPSIRQIYVDVLQSSKSTILQPGWYPHIQNEYAEVSVLETILHNLMGLPTNSNSCQTVAVKDNLVILQEMLNLLRDNINNVSVKDLDYLKDIDTVIIEVGLFVYSLYNGGAEKKEVMAPGEVNTTLVFYLMGNIQHTNTVICLTVRKAFQSNLPRIHGLGCVDFLLNNLKELQSFHSDSLASFANQLQIIQKELEHLQPFLQAVAEERHSDLDNIQRCATQVIDKANEIEYIVDVCIRNVAPIWCLERWLFDIIKEITLIRDEVAEIHETTLFGDSTKIVTAHASSVLPRSPWKNKEVVGFEEVIEKLRNQLIKGTRGQDVISIVGMPGLGKTTLAYRLYYDGLVVSHFDIRAQCCVSQVYKRKDLLLAILRDAVGVDSEGKNKPADILADELRKALFSKRYLILVDDVWEASAWDDLRGCFPDKDNGSRIILTTRSHEVSNYARVESEPLPLRMFRDDESWELLRKKVFCEDSCSPLLMNIGKQIAKRCGRLPLSVSLVGGILAAMEKKEECWEQVANNLGPHIHKDSRAIIEQSYQILPYHLSSCFLYFGAFLEDSVINVSKLIRLWISEGFIKSFEGKSLEDIAKGYLEDLIKRNLVMSTKNSYGGKIKACQIHDVLHDFCKERAKEENLLRWIKRDQNANHSSRFYCPMQLAHRMSIYGEEYHIGEWSSCWSHVGSVILHNNCLADDIVYHILRAFRFLKVLDLELIQIDSFPTGLIYLRYFSALTWDLSILSCMTHCWNLETLVLDNYIEETLPVTLLDMIKLRNLHISSCTIVENAEGILENSKILHNLKTLSNPYFSCARDAEFLLSRAPNLQELTCTVQGMDKFRYYELKFLTRIETLKIRDALTSFTANNLPFFISAPNLKKLTLDRFYLHPRYLSEIGSLQNLQVLKLRRIWNKGWKVRNGEFLQLKVLKLREVVFEEEWTVADEAFPNLERLVLINCHSLKEIPSCFGEISSLKSIEVKDCEECVGNSARDIRETQVEDYQNAGFQVFIHESANDNPHSGDDNSDDDDIEGDVNGGDDDDSGGWDGNDDDDNENEDDTEDEDEDE